MEKFVVRLLGIAQNCKDLPARVELMRVANDLADILESRKPRSEDETRH